jgi:glutamate dehydrogenase/leucine dehydrogenase
MRRSRGLGDVYKRQVNARVIDLMRAAFERFYAFSQESKLPNRLAATVLGVKTIADAHRMRGLHP